MEVVNILGFVAGTLTTVSLLPQMIKTWRTKSAKDISLEMFCILAAGVLLWIIYGIRIMAYPIIICNSVSLAFIAMNIVLKIKYN
jgi:MtN3 and saliva related transmembrane protein